MSVNGWFDGGNVVPFPEESITVITNENGVEIPICPQCKNCIPVTEEEWNNSKDHEIVDCKNLIIFKGQRSQCCCVSRRHMDIEREDIDPNEERRLKELIKQERLRVLRAALRLLEFKEERGFVLDLDELDKKERLKLRIEDIMFFNN